MGMLSFTGTVLLDGLSPVGDRMQLAHRMAYVPQIAPRLAATVGELITVTSQLRELSPTAIVELQFLADNTGENVDGWSFGVCADPGEVFVSYVEPGEVEVTFSGPRRALVLGDLDVIEVRVDALLVQLGRRTFQVTPDLVTHPGGLQVHEVNPKQIRLSVAKDGGS